MRLIDADELEKNRYTHLIRFWEGKVIDSVKLSDVPTINLERPKGKWEQWGDTDCWMCSECKYEAVLFDFTPAELDMHYCPNCGAKMEDENET